MRKNRWVISDLHLDGSKSDDFGEEGSKNLLKFLKDIPPKSLILNGDILDIWASDLTTINSYYGPLLRELFDRAEWYVLGNHDREMAGRFDYMGVPICGELILGNTLFTHGHRFDLVNSDGHVLGSTITKIVSWIERNVYADIDKSASKLEAWVRKQGRFGTPKIYRDKAIQYASGLSINGGKIEQICLGHTHKWQPVTIGFVKYGNSGTRLRGKEDFLEIEVEV